MSYGANGRGASKANANTTCQKCLQKGHYSYECKAGVQDRPYTSRPSRSQQLLNPHLRPALTIDGGADTADKSGVADDMPAKKAEERGRKRSADDHDMDGSPPPKRTRSMSLPRSGASHSVSTLSTNKARSKSPERVGGAGEAGFAVKGSDGQVKPGRGTKRARESSSSSSLESGGEGGGRFGNGHVGEERNTRSRVLSNSPEERGRRRRRRSRSEERRFS